jgi:hypothetical protein
MRDERTPWKGECTRRTLGMYLPALFRVVMRPRIPACILLCEGEIEESAEMVCDIMEEALHPR